jgi:hypothetical protein
MRASTKHGFSLIYPWSIAPGKTLVEAYAEGSIFAAAILDAWSPADLLKTVVVRPAAEVDLLPEWGDVIRQYRRPPERVYRPHKISDPHFSTSPMKGEIYFGTSVRKLNSRF